MDAKIVGIIAAGVMVGCGPRTGTDFQALDLQTALEQAVVDTQAATVNPQTRKYFRFLADVRKAAGTGDSVEVFAGHKIEATAQWSEELLVLAVTEGQQTLAALGYGTEFTGEIDPETRRAVSAYEVARGLPQTGNPLAPTTWQQLRADGKAIQPQVIGRMKLVILGPSWASAEGVLVSSQEDSVVDNLLGLDVDCVRSAMNCRVVTATEQLEIHSENYRIVSWDAQEIHAVNSFPCARYAMTINGIQKSLEQTRTTIDTTGQCAFMDLKPLHSHLEGSMELIARQPETSSLYRWGAKVRQTLQRPDTASRVQNKSGSDSLGQD